jgi:hypothetical protein
MTIIQITKKDLEDALAKHTNDEMPKIKVMIDEAIQNAQEHIMKAFPNGVENHREAHERMIAAARAEESFWRDLKMKIAEKSIWGILQILLILTIGTLAIKLGIGSVFGLGK